MWRSCSAACGQIPWSPIRAHESGGDRDGPVCEVVYGLRIGAGEPARHYVPGLARVPANLQDGRQLRLFVSPESILVSVSSIFSLRDRFGIDYPDVTANQNERRAGAIGVFESVRR